MLYDEQGRPFVEPPLLPEEQHVFNVVKDYQRMFYEYHKIKKNNEQLRKTNDRLSRMCQSQKGQIQSLTDEIRHCVKHMKKNGLQPSTHTEDFLRIKNIK